MTESDAVHWPKLPMRDPLSRCSYPMRLTRKLLPATSILRACRGLNPSSSCLCVVLIRLNVTTSFGRYSILTRYLPSISFLGRVFSVSLKKRLDGLVRKEEPQSSFSFPNDRNSPETGLAWTRHSFTKNRESESVSPAATPSFHQR